MLHRLSRLRRLHHRQRPRPKASPFPPSSAPAPAPSVKPVPLRDFQGHWSSMSASPLGANGTLTVTDRLDIEASQIIETIKTEWISDGTLVFSITLRLRFGELWTFSNQLNARCLSADVVDTADPTKFRQICQHARANH